MSFWGRLFGSDDAATKLIDHAANGLDKLVYTSEEQAEDAARSTTEARKMVIDWLSATQGQNLARRLLALMIASVWLLQYLGAQILAIIAVWVSDPISLKLGRSVEILSANAEQMDGAMMLLLSFYFAAPHMGKIVDSALSKFGGRP